MSSAATPEPPPAPLYARLGMTFDLRAVNWLEGVRAGLAILPFVMARAIVHNPLLSLAALAAYLTCLCDTGGPIRQRVQPTLGYAIAGAMILPLMGVMRWLGPAWAVVAGTIALFATSMLRVYSQQMMTVGNLLGVAVVLGVDTATPPTTALAEAGVFLIGGLWSALLTLVIWRIHPHRQARIALAAAYRKLSALIADLVTLLRVGVHDPAAWEMHARHHRRACREAIEAARAGMSDTVRRLGAGSQRGAQGVIRLEVAEQLFAAAIALSDLLEYERDESKRARAARILRRVRAMLAVLAASIVTDRLRAGDVIGRALQAMQDEAAALPEGDPLRAVEESIIERLRIAATLSVPANYAPSAGKPGQELPLRKRLLGPIRANLKTSSLALRHALRTAALALPALTVTMIWYGPYEHWLTITFIVTMQPYFAQTFTRALERIGGTVLGGLIAAAMALVFTTPLALNAAMVIWLMMAISLRYVSFGLFITVLTPMIVLLVETAQPGESPWVVAGMRALFTVIGGVIALAGSYLLWPSWEPARLGAEVQRAVAAHRTYAEAVLAYLSGDGSVASMDAARRESGLGSNNLEAALSRALLEPARLPPDRLEAATLIDAALRRMDGRLAVLQMRDRVTEPAPLAVLRAWRAWISRALSSVAGGGGGSGGGGGTPEARPSLRGVDIDITDGLSRIARQIELVSRARPQV
jgi:uncharacterized membrane protein YccC